MFHLKKIDYIIIFLFLLVLVVPIYEVFAPNEYKPENECWEKRFIWEDLAVYLSYLTLCIIWFFSLFKKSKILKTILFIFSAINLFATIFAIMMPAQDLVFLWGILIFILLCFLLMLYTLFKKD